MIVVDVPAAITGLLRAGRVRAMLADEDVHVPHLIAVMQAKAEQARGSAAE